MGFLFKGIKKHVEQHDLKTQTNKKKTGGTKIMISSWYAFSPFGRFISTHAFSELGGAFAWPGLPRTCSDSAVGRAMKGLSGWNQEDLRSCCQRHQRSRKQTVEDGSPLKLWTNNMFLVCFWHKNYSKVLHHGPWLIKQTLHL